MDFVRWVLTFIVMVVSVLGVLLVLMQSGKGGGLLGESVGQDVISSKGRGDLLTRLTTIFIAIFILGSFGIAYLEYKNMVFIEDPKALDMKIEELQTAPEKETVPVKKEAPNKPKPAVQKEQTPLDS